MEEESESERRFSWGNFIWGVIAGIVLTIAVQGLFF